MSDDWKKDFEDWRKRFEAVAKKWDPKMKDLLAQQKAAMYFMAKDLGLEPTDQTKKPNINPTVEAFKARFTPETEPYDQSFEELSIVVAKKAGWKIAPHENYPTEKPHWWTPSGSDHGPIESEHQGVTFRNPLGFAWDMNLIYEWIIEPLSKNSSYFTMTSDREYDEKRVDRYGCPVEEIWWTVSISGGKGEAEEKARSLPVAVCLAYLKFEERT